MRYLPARVPATLSGERARQTRAWIAATATALLLVLSLPAGVPCALAVDAADASRSVDSTATGPLFGIASDGIDIRAHSIDPRLVRRVLERQKQRALKAGVTPDMTSAQLAKWTSPDGIPGWDLMPSMGDLKIFALLVEFPDHQHVTSASDAHAKLFGDGSPVGSGYPYESLANYYERSSYGQLNFDRGVTLGWWMAPYNRSAVDPTQAGLESLIKDALTNYAAQGHDFSQYDNDNDGYIDYFLVIWSGPIGDGIWSWFVHFAWTDASFTVSGKHVAGYTWHRELNMGTFPVDVAIHETGHALGLPDLYDQDAANGPAGGVGWFDMMDAPRRGDFNCFSKWLMGWVSPTIVSAGNQAIAFNPSGTFRDGSCAFVMPQLTEDNLFSEYFMVQYRKKTMNDDVATFPAEGLWIWHVDATLRADGTSFQFDNTRTHHKLLRPMEADGKEEIEQNKTMNVGDIFGAGSRFGDGTFPSSRRYGGEPTGVVVSDIAPSGSHLSAQVNLLGRVDAGYTHTFAVKTDGSLWGWGKNGYGQLGVGNAIDSSSPLPVGAGLDWRFVSAGGGHSVGVKTDGSLWGWGRNEYGEVGNDDYAEPKSPVPVGDSGPWVMVAAGGDHSAALRADRQTMFKGLTRWAWGYNYHGELGDGLNANVFLPKLLTDGCSDVEPCGYSWALLATGFHHNEAVRIDGTLWAWGQNDHGQLGNNSTGHRYSPHQIQTAADWVFVSAGGSHTLAIKRGGSLWAWGWNNFGQLGDGYQVSEIHLPKQIGTDSDWALVAAGGSHSLALKRDGSLWGWGMNGYGELGLGIPPYQVGVPTRIGNDNDWDYVTTGDHYSLAVKIDGTLWATGYNGYGQLGDGTTTDGKVFRQILSTLATNVDLTAVPASPRQVGALVTFTAAASGGMGSYECQFWLNAAGTWSITQDYSADNTWDWDTTGLAAGVYPVRVYVRNVGSVAPLEVSSSQDFVLLPVAQKFTLSVAKLGTGSGTVSSNPTGIDCGADCSEDYASGTSVTLAVATAAGSVFNGWGGTCSGSGACVVSMTSARNVTAAFSIVPGIELTSLSLNTPGVSGCKSVNGRVTISEPAPPEGVVVALGDTLGSASTPASVKLPYGVTTKSFTVKTLPVSTSESGTVSASLGGTSLSADLTVRPMGLTSLTLTPTSVVGIQPVTGKATLECNAGPGPITVDLSSNNPAVASPVAASIVVPQGVKTASFDVTTSAVLAKSYATIAGVANGITKSKKLTVNVAASVSPASLKFGSVVLGQTSAQLVATLTNKGAVPFAVNSIGLTGTAASWFAQTSDCPATLAAGASCSVSVTFKPFAAASKSAKLSIATSATATALSVSLSGTGVLPP